MHPVRDGDHGYSHHRAQDQVKRSERRARERHESGRALKKMARRGHEQRHRATETRMPGCAHAQIRRRNEQPEVHPRLGPGHMAHEHGGANQAQAPVHPRERHRYGGHQRDGTCRRSGVLGQRREETVGDRRGGHEIAGQHDQRHLHRKWAEGPKAAAPRDDDCGRSRTGEYGSRPEGDQRQQDRDGEGAGDEAFGGCGQRVRESGEHAAIVAAGRTGRRSECGGGVGCLRRQRRRHDCPLPRSGHDGGAEPDRPRHVFDSRAQAEEHERRDAR